MARTAALGSRPNSLEPSEGLASRLMFGPTDHLDRSHKLPLSSGAAISLAILGAVLPFLCVLLGFSPADVAMLAAFLAGSMVLWWMPLFQSLPRASRLLLIFLVLRPILDATLSKDVHRSTLPLQNAFALSTFVILFFSGRQFIPSLLRKFPSNLLIALLLLATVAWPLGGISAGASGFLRTTWGLLLALLLGTLFRTERHINIFIRTLFYSSVFVLAILAFNLHQGEYIGDVWRVTGQFGVATTLAEVCFSLFLLGLYTFENGGRGSEKLITLSLLILLALAI